MSAKDFYNSGEQGQYNAPQQGQNQQNQQSVGQETGDRGLGATLLGGTAGAFLGSKMSSNHSGFGGILGAIGGAVAANKIEDKFKNHHHQQQQYGNQGGYGGPGGPNGPGGYGVHRVFNDETEPLLDTPGVERPESGPCSNTLVELFLECGNETLSSAGGVGNCTGMVPEFEFEFEIKDLLLSSSPLAVLSTESSSVNSGNIERVVSSSFNASTSVNSFPSPSVNLSSFKLPLVDEEEELVVEFSADCCFCCCCGRGILLFIVGVLDLFPNELERNLSFSLTN
ncbi:unnamed protein product [[Candida] boidinii]|nr:unnamed protein product [[Candida] boidinii]